MLWELLPAQQDLGYITLTVPYLCHSLLLKSAFRLCVGNDPIISLLSLILIKKVIPYVTQPTCIMHVRNSSRFSLYITSVYSRASKENGNWFFWLNIPSTNNNIICFVYILTQHLLRLWCICCIFGGCVLNEYHHLVISNSKKASITKWLCAKMGRVEYWLYTVRLICNHHIIKFLHIQRKHYTM